MYTATINIADRYHMFGNQGTLYDTFLIIYLASLAHSMQVDTNSKVSW